MLPGKRENLGNFENFIPSHEDAVIFTYLFKIEKNMKVQTDLGMKSAICYHNV